jgi:hypothetical protein
MAMEEAEGFSCEYETRGAAELFEAQNLDKIRPRVQQTIEIDQLHI